MRRTLALTAGISLAMTLMACSSSQPEAAAPSPSSSPSEYCPPADRATLDRLMSYFAGYGSGETIYEATSFPVEITGAGSTHWDSLIAGKHLIAGERGLWAYNSSLRLGTALNEAAIAAMPNIAPAPEVRAAAEEALNSTEAAAALACVKYDK